MPDIVLKDRNGNDITFPGINSIKVKTTDGGTQEFLNGEMVEKTVTPDFTDGDIAITAEDGTFISKVTIEKPKDLLPENIRDGTEIGGVVGSAFVVDVVKTTVLEEQEVALTMSEGVPMPFVQMNVDATFVGGETYTVTWNGADYVCVAASLEQDGLVFVMLGNAMVTGGEDDGVPFACQFVSSEITGGEALLLIMSMYDTTDVTYTVGISQKTREDVETAEVELALADGDQEVTPSTSDKVLTKVTIKKPENLTPENVAKDVNIAGVVGTLAAETEEATVNLDFSNGDMEITPTEDKSFSKVNIPVPGTLVPENIAEGVDIAGIIGTLAAGGGGSNVKVVYGYKKIGSSNPFTHNLGVMPDIVLIWGGGNQTISNGYTAAWIGLSAKFRDAIGMEATSTDQNRSYYKGSSNTFNWSSAALPIETQELTSAALVFKATETDMYLKGTRSSSTYYNYLLIGGLA